MQRTDSTGKAKLTHRRMGNSTTLNRRYVKRPGQEMDATTSVTVRRSPKIKRFNDFKEPMRVMVSESADKKQNMMAPEVMEEMQLGEVYDSMDTDEMLYSGMTTEMFGSSMPQDMAKMSMSSTTPQEMAEMSMSSAEPQEMTETRMNYVEPHPIQTVANTRMQARKRTASEKVARPTAKELKERAIQKALASAAMTTETKSKSKRQKSKKMSLFSVGLGRVVLAFSCAALAVFAIVYFVNMNMPDVSLKVAAMQTGINASYPSYVPRDYSISSIVSENKKITLVFENGQTGEKFNIYEETSSWDSNALLSNYIKPTYDENYTTVKEQGLTIYISGSNAAWVNGGVMYKITTDGENLTNKQIRSIATSL